jgi:hypothetical protein
MSYHEQLQQFQRITIDPEVMGVSRASEACV